ncbi:unnamed protein product [Somion occarium]|uniref:Uncharacterized protein n=1 Tax=Somion occarium TaxID=3059160 RepID=A0ABP1DET4_9APHY
MSVVHDDGRAHRCPRSPDVFEEGSSSCKDMYAGRQPSGVDIPAEELNPEAQCRQLELYSDRQLNILRVLMNDPDFDLSAQDQLLSYWHDLKAQ